MWPYNYGPDGGGAVRRAYRRSPLRTLIRVSWTHRGLTETDVMVASYPRSGNLWLRFMLFELLSGAASMDRVLSSMPYVGKHHTAPALVPNRGRLIKTHEPYQPKYRRAVHLVRDPRDIVVSYYKFLQAFAGLEIPRSMHDSVAFDRFIDAFICGRVEAYGTWIGHLESWRQARTSGRADVLTVRYEDIRSDPSGMLEAIAHWLGVEVTQDGIAQAVENASIRRMREATQGRTPPRVRSSPNLAPIVNSGLVGGWRDVLDGRQAARFNVFADGLATMGYPPA